MIAFDVSVNGRRVCVAGVSGAGVLTVMMTSVLRRARGGRPAMPAKELKVEVGGMRSPRTAPDEHLRWIAGDLRVGDQVTVRVRRARTVDPPAARHRDDPAMIERAKRRYVARLRAELGDARGARRPAAAAARRLRRSPRARGR